MTQFLEAIIIEGHSGKQRRLPFQPGVNVITGIGSKGKSTILHIIAYCLGAERCDIPVGRTRDYADWYFLLLNLGKGRALIGRRAPPTGSQVSEEAYFAHGSSPEVPRPVTSNHTIWSACRYLAELLGLPRGEFRLHDRSMYDDLATDYGTVEVRDLLPLVLQPQDIIATRRLFASFTDRPAKDRFEIMKIALGIVSPRLLQLRAQRDRLIRHRRGLEREAKLQQENYESAMSRLGSVWQQAVFAGVVTSGPLISPDQVRLEVEKLKAASTAEIATVVTDNKALAGLEARSQELRRELRQVQRDLRQIGQLKQLARETAHSIQGESSRMRVVDVLGVPMQTDVPCPMCGANLGTTTLTTLAEMQTELEAELAFTASIPRNLDNAESTLQADDLRLRREIREVERELDGLRKQEPALTLTQERVERERKIGALEAALSGIPAMPNREPRRDALDAELNDVEGQLKSLPAEREALDVERALSSRITAIARQFERMNLEGGLLSFDSTFSTLEREQNGKREPLRILGGAEIFVMYHISAFLGLHEYLSQPDTSSFVPRLVVFDQPSQAYFPAESDRQGTDIDAVRSIYDVIFRCAERLENRFQIIALDHADFSDEDERFRQVRVDWHGVDGLIPEEDASGSAT